MGIVVAHEQNAATPRFRIQALLEAVGADILVKDHYPSGRILFFDCQRVLDSDRAADAAAVLLGGSNALDHDNGVGNWAADQPLLEFLLGEDARVSAIAVLWAAIFLRASRQDGHAVWDALPAAIDVLDLTGEVAGEALRRDDAAAEVDGDAGVLIDLLGQADQRGDGRMPVERDMHFAQVAAEYIFFLDEMHVEALISE